MLLLKKLQLNNFISHENSVLEFSEQEKASLEGPSGVGKSSVFDGIIFALYGIGRADNRNLVRKGAKKGFVCLELSRETDTVIITRTVTTNGKHSLEVTIQQADGSRTAHPLSGIRPLQEWIEKELIGASYLLFINSIAYVQGNSDSFVSQSAPKRKELLLEIARGGEDYTKYYEIARQTLSKLESDHSMASGQVLELEGYLRATQARIGDRDVQVKAITTATERLANMVSEIKMLEEKKSSLMAILNNVAEIDKSLTMALEDEKEASDNLAKSREKILDKPRLLKMLEDIPGYEKSIKDTVYKLDQLRQDLAYAEVTIAERNEVFSRKPVINANLIQTEIENAEKKIAKIEAEPVCPSGSACPYSGDHSIQINDIKGQIKGWKETAIREITALTTWISESGKLPPPVDTHSIIAAIGNTENHLANLKTELARYDVIQFDINTIETVEKEIPNLEKTLHVRSCRVGEIRKKKAEAEAAADGRELSRISGELDARRREQAVFNDAIARATMVLETIDRDEAEMKTINNRIISLKNETVEIQEKSRKVGMVKDAFGRNGVETIVIDYLLSSLEDKINVVLAKLSDFRIKLDTQKKSADGENNIEGFFITVCNEMGEEMPYESYSGGEKVRITFAISEALASLGSKKVGFRLVDEAVLALDENSLESFMTVVQTLLTDFNQVFFISHIQDIKDAFDKKINIVKRNGISTVE